MNRFVSDPLFNQKNRPPVISAAAWQVPNARNARQFALSAPPRQKFPGRPDDHLESRLLPYHSSPMPSVPTLGPVMFDFAGPAATAEDFRRLEHPAAGGIILFSRNYADPEQLSDLVGSVREIRPEILIAVDHEGGRVQRFRNGFTKLPPAAAYSRCFANPAAAAAAAESTGWLMAIELRSFGIDFSFAPVLDLDTRFSKAIGDRSFSEDPQEATRLAGAFLRGMHRAGMSGVGKHFPGHGGVAEDSHVDLPVDLRDFAQIEQHDLLPFREVIALGLEGIMPAHVRYPACDDFPAGYSQFWIDAVLRQRLNFRGVVFSDDLSMAGAGFAGGVVDRAQAALAAGCDMVLVCNAPEHVDSVLDAVGGSCSADIASRLATMRGRFPVDRRALTDSALWQDAVSALRQWSTA